MWQTPLCVRTHRPLVVWDAFLDNHSLERARGITIFSKQARFQTERLAVTFVDTPGHVDFAPEAERAMTVPDYAILVVSGTDGVQAHTETLWKLPDYYADLYAAYGCKPDLWKMCSVPRRSSTCSTSDAESVRWPCNRKNFG